MLDRAKVRQLFAEAAELPDDQVGAFLVRACGTDAELREEIESLLAAVSKRPAFLGSPTAPASGLAAGPSGEAAGMTIGHYRLLEEIGQGGFGTVYVAEQSEPVRRRVAFKIIKLGMDTRAVVARFEAERQALAMMEHPNIARVFDAGATETGRPYFVMELVRGDPITVYCDRNNLNIPERLGIFVQVCQAVQHAHSKGVIHRDIKPGNVLVATEDGRPHAKVIDFGIAKATQHTLTEKTIFTEFRQFVGTPEYMSPEQAESSLNIDTRTDVYSLGVLLYELLTGATPFDSKALREAAYGEIQRIIREVEPPKPSTRVSTLGAAMASVASQRRTAAGRLSPLLRGDLDWIVMRCLEKDRARRYATSDALAADLEAFLRGDVVSAVPPSLLYRLRKIAGRNRKLVAAAGAVVIVLLLGVAGTSWGMVSARQAEKAARDDRDAAAAVRDFLARTFEGVAPQVARGRDTELLRALMDKAAVRIGSGELAGNVQAEAELRIVIAEVNVELAHFEAARLVIAPLNHDEMLRTPSRVRLLVVRATLALSASNADESERLLGEAQRMLDAQGESDPRLRYKVIDGLMSAAKAKNQTARQEALAAQTVLTARAMRPPDPELLAQCLLELGKAIKGQGRHDEAVLTLGQALHAIDDVELAAGDAGTSPVRVQILLARATLYGQQYKFDLAELDLNQALRDAERLFPVAHPTIVEVHNARANAYLHLGRYEEGLAEMEVVIAGQRAIFGTDSLHVADALAGVAFIHYTARRWQQALDRLMEVERIREKHLSPKERAVFSEWTMMVDCLDSLGRTDEALELAQRSCDMCLAAAEPASDVALLARNTLMLSMYFAGKDREAADVGRHLLADCAVLRPNSLPAWLHLTYAVTGESLVNAGDREDADESVRLLRTCVALRGSKFGDSDFRVTRARLQLGRALVMSVVQKPAGEPVGQAPPKAAVDLAVLAEAESLLVPNFDILVRGIESLDPPHRARWVERAGQALIILYEAWGAADPGAGKNDLARQWRERLASSLKSIAPGGVPAPRK